MDQATGHAKIPIVIAQPVKWIMGRTNVTKKGCRHTTKERNLIAIAITIKELVAFDEAVTLRGGFRCKDRSNIAVICY